ncbi:hypothetical protein L6452_04272 [Arctium lappa]|uniref:Uncharacterized protein n=1 Tax=Arctium lappa TaxID=4217 RepID=A0ACB9FPK9_ARCLA|nr:hypothetical protein L6452_04272 [Arctium lappa]
MKTCNRHEHTLILVGDEDLVKDERAFLWMKLSLPVDRIWRWVSKLKVKQGVGRGLQVVCGDWSSSLCVGISTYGYPFLSDILSLSFTFPIALFYGFQWRFNTKSSNLLLTRPSKTHRIVIRVIDLDLVVFLQIWLFDRRLIQVFAVWFGFTGINDVLLRFGWLWRRSKEKLTVLFRSGFEFRLDRVIGARRLIACY